MAENIEIVVQDKVDSSVSKKLKDIAEQAKSAHSSIYILKRAMKGISFNAVSKIQSEVKKVSSLEYNQMSKTYDVWRKKMDAYYASAQAKLEKGRMSSVNKELNSQANIKQGGYQSQINTENNRNKLKDGSYQSQINAENIALQAQSKIKQGLYQQEINLQNKRANLTQGNLQSQINAENEAIKGQNSILAGNYASQIRVESAREKLRSGDYVSQINSENRALEAQKKILAGNAAEEARSADAKDRLLNRINPLRSALQDYKTQVLEANNLLRQGAISANQYGEAVEHAKNKLERTRIAQTQWNESLLKTNNTSKLSRMHLVNLGYQLNDVGVSLASGQNPMVVFIQQGSQIAGIAAAAGVSMGAMAKAALGLIAPFLPLAAAVGAVVGAFALFRAELNNQEPMKQYVKTLGLTHNEIKRLKDVTVTYGDVFKGFFKTLEDRFGTTSMFKKFGAGAIYIFKQVLEFTKGVFIMIYAIGKATYETLLAVWNNFPTMFGNFFVNAANVAIKALNSITDVSTDLVNSFIRSLNSLPKGLLGFDIIPEFTKTQLPTLENKFKGSIANIGDTFSNTLVESVKDGEKAVDKFGKDWGKNSQDIAKDRLKKQATDILEGKSSSDKSAEKRATALAKINAELDNELERMFMLKPEREMQARYDQIEEKLIGKKIKLTQQESDAIKEKIKIIRSATIAQQKYDQLYDEIQGPLESYNGLIEAGDELFKRRVISQEKFAAIFANAAEQYKQASDTLYSYNKSINEQTKLLGFNAKEREIQSKLMDAENDLRSKNVPNLEKELELLGEQYRTLQQLTSVRAAYDAVYSSTKGKQEELKNAIEGTNQAFRNGLLSSEKYTIELNSIGNEFIETKMILGDASWAEVQTSALYQMISNFKGGVIEIRDIFGNMFTQIEDGFANSIGKAAIYGNDLKTSFYELSREILSGLISSLVKLGIQWVMNATLADSLAAASAATQTAMSVATASAISAAYATPAALVSLASYGANAAPAMAGISATTALAKSMSMMPGFKQGGYTGDGPISQVAGPVHRKEFVFDAAATQRIGVGTLESLRSGAAGVAQNGSSVGKGSQGNINQSTVKNEPTQQPVNVNVPFTAVVVQSKESAMAALKSTEGRAFIIETLQKNKQTVAKIAGVK